jgi:hypothetical protein
VRVGPVGGSAWDCGPAADRSLTTLTCTTTPAAGEGALLVVQVRGPRPEGSIAATSPGDPSSTNDAVTFRAGSQLLLL